LFHCVSCLFSSPHPPSCLIYFLLLLSSPISLLYILFFCRNVSSFALERKRHMEFS
jgi:hypothetical protein